MLRMEFLPNSDIIWELIFNWMLCLESVGACTKGTQLTDAFSSLVSKKAGGYSQLPKYPSVQSKVLWIWEQPQSHRLIIWVERWFSQMTLAITIWESFMMWSNCTSGTWPKCKGIFFLRLSPFTFKYVDNLEHSLNHLGPGIEFHDVLYKKNKS